MESKWREDFLSVARTGNFSKSAAERHVTQSAFSRRIKALEQWVGVALIDRSSYPTRLTARVSSSARWPAIRWRCCSRRGMTCATCSTVIATCC